MSHPKNLLLARVQEVAQLYFDRVVSFIAKNSHQELHDEDKDRLLVALCSATAALGRHTAAVLSVNEVDMREHLPDLFERLDKLENVSRHYGGPTIPGIFLGYRRSLQEG